jgi:Ras-related protein Rab-1A
MDTVDYLFKVLLVGNSGVGKSTLVERYVDDKFNELHLATIGVDFKIKTLFLDDKIVKLQIWDTAGQERFRSITTSYYRGAHGIFIVYDVTNRTSFNDVKNWIREAGIFHILPKNILLVGNKIDYVSKRQVSTEEGIQLSESLGCSFIETSAKSSLQSVTHSGVNEMFELMARILKTQKILSRTEAPKKSLKVGDEIASKNKKCNC